MRERKEGRGRTIFVGERGGSKYEYKTVCPASGRLEARTLYFFEISRHLLWYCPVTTWEVYLRVWQTRTEGGSALKWEYLPLLEC